MERSSLMRFEGRDRRSDTEALSPTARSPAAPTPFEAVAGDPPIIFRAESLKPLK